MKLMNKQKKHEENSVKMDIWFKRQAEVLDTETKIKKMKEDRKKEEKIMKQREEEMKKSRANEAFKFWMKKKEEEKFQKAKNTNWTLL